MAAPELMMVRQQSGMSFEKAVAKYLADGYKLVGQPFDLQGQPAQLVGKGDIGTIGGGSGGDGGTPIDVGVKTINGKAPDAQGDAKVEVHNLIIMDKGTVTTYTLKETDRDGLLLFNTPDKVTVTLPENITVSTNPAKVFYIQNTAGSVTLVAEGKLNSFTDHGDANAILGAIRVPGGYSVSGTNTPLEES
ncbi:hypothetical protein [Pseudomonas phage vB_Pae-PA14]|nr:hypothetical protein [Pseudomonas phage vB_Pae-PA14]